MHCEYGGAVTFTASEPGYRLRIVNGGTLSIILSEDDIAQLQERIRAVLDKERPHA